MMDTDKVTKFEHQIKHNLLTRMCAGMAKRYDEKNRYPIGFYKPNRISSMSVEERRTRWNMRVHKASEMALRCQEIHASRF